MHLTFNRLVLFLCCFTSVSAFFAYQKISIYKDVNIYTTDISEVAHTLNNRTRTCTVFRKCDLLEGDILIRRLKTERTHFITTFSDAYFTHVATYIGENSIVEAVGNEKDNDDEILVSSLNILEWGNKEAQWVIIRPSITPEAVNVLTHNLKQIANDNSYTFGLTRNQSRSKKRTCADLVFYNLLNEGLIDIQDTPTIIPPDYLFSVLIQNKDTFELVGSNIIDIQIITE